MKHPSKLANTIQQKFAKLSHKVPVRIIADFADPNLMDSAMTEFYFDDLKFKCISTVAEFTIALKSNQQAEYYSAHLLRWYLERRNFYEENFGDHFELLDWIIENFARIKVFLCAPEMKDERIKYEHWGKAFIEKRLNMKIPQSD